MQNQRDKRDSLLAGLERRPQRPHRPRQHHALPITRTTGHVSTGTTVVPFATIHDVMHTKGCRSLRTAPTPRGLCPPVTANDRG
jgi:hypothetical protein